MGLENITADAMAHFGTGVGLSLLDYITAKLANPKSDRLERKKSCLESIDFLLDQAKGGEETGADPLRYAERVEAVKEYMHEHALAKVSIPLAARIKEFFSTLIRHEKINNLTYPRKFALALGIEILYDSVFGFHYYTVVRQKSPIAAISENLYQVPAFFFGLVLGNYVKKFFNWFLTPGKEKDMDRTIRKLLAETDIVRIVVEYEPAEALREQLLERGFKAGAFSLTRAGSKAYRHILDVSQGAMEAADALIHYKERRDEKHAKEMDSTKKRFDDLTRNR